MTDTTDGGVPFGGRGGDGTGGGGLLAIGAFSRASSLSVKALRAYHETGLLVPASVDPWTGYRAYHPSQLTDAAVIRRLRDLDLPLGQVAEVVHAQDPEVTRRVLEAHEAAMRNRLADVTRIVAELQEGVATPTQHTPVHVREVPSQHTLAVRGEADEAGFAAFLDAAYATLGAAVASLDVVPAGAPGALYEPTIPDDGPQPIEAYMPIPAPVPVPSGLDVIVGEVPAARVAVLVHAGGYDAIDGTYSLLGGWVGTNARPLNGARVREVYVVGPTEVEDPSRFRTEIHWPIEPGA